LGEFEGSLNCRVRQEIAAGVLRRVFKGALEANLPPAGMGGRRPLGPLC